MREDYEITIIGRQTIDAQTDEIQVDTLGDYTERGGAKYISYTEYADEAPYNGQLKVLKIENEDTVTMLTPGTPPVWCWKKASATNAFMIPAQACSPSAYIHRR